MWNLGQGVKWFIRFGPLQLSLTFFLPLIDSRTQPRTVTEERNDRPHVTRERACYDPVAHDDEIFSVGENLSPSTRKMGRKPEIFTNNWFLFIIFTKNYKKWWEDEREIWMNFLSPSRQPQATPWTRLAGKAGTQTHNCTWEQTQLLEGWLIQTRGAAHLSVNASVCLECQVNMLQRKCPRYRWVTWWDLFLYWENRGTWN